MAKCQVCKRELPNDLINAFIENDKCTDMCAVCALKARNSACGLPLNTPFTGTLANEFYQKTIKYYEDTGQ